MYPSRLLQSLEKKKTTFGRKPDNDVVLEESHVSFKHCMIVNKGNEFFIEDLKSSNGTFVNGKKIKGRVRLKNNDVIQFGRKLPAYRFRLHSMIV